MAESPLWQRDAWKKGRRKRVGSYKSGHNDSIDDVPPPGFHRNELSVEPPPRLINRSLQKRGPSTQAAHISEALDAKED